MTSTGGRRSPAIGQEIAACALTLGLSVAAHRVLPAQARVPAGVAATGAAVLMARRLGLTWDDLGLSPAAAPRGALAGIAAASVLGAVTVGGLVVPRARRYYLEDRIAGASFGEMIHAVFVRIPFGTAVPEELLFRGVLLALLARNHSPLTAAIASSLVFGLWHVLPALERIKSNPGTRHRHGNPVQTAAVVAAHVGTTAVAGLGFALLRFRSGSIVAPIIAHAAPNAVGFLGGWAVARLTRPRKQAEKRSCAPSEQHVSSG